MADSLSRAIADETVGRKIGRGLRFGLDAGARAANPLSALYNTAETVAAPVRGFLGEIGAGFAGGKQPGPAVDADLEDALAPLTPGIVLPQSEPPEAVTKAPPTDIDLATAITGAASKSVTPVEMGKSPEDLYKGVTAPVLPKTPDLPRINHTYGTTKQAGVFGALANNVNAAASAGEQLFARKAKQRDFTNSVAAETANATNYDKLYDSTTKRLAVRSASEAAGLKSGVDALKNIKELQEAQVIASRRRLLQPHIQAAMDNNDLNGAIELSASLAGHHIPDQIVPFAAGIGPDGKPIPASAVSARRGTYLSQAPQGVLVDAVKAAGSHPEGTILQDPKSKERYVIKNGQKVPF